MNIPATEGALYDLMQERFGIGDYDEANPRLPWWRARNTEIAKLRAQMRRRRLTIEDLAIAIEYATQTNRAITGVWQLCDLVGIAKKNMREANRYRADHEKREELEAAAAQAHARGDAGWAARLYAADTKSAPVVLEQWREHMARSR